MVFVVCIVVASVLLHFSFEFIRHAISSAPELRQVFVRNAACKLCFVRCKVCCHWLLIHSHLRIKRVDSSEDSVPDKQNWCAFFDHVVYHSSHVSLLCRGAINECISFMFHVLLYGIGMDVEHSFTYFTNVHDCLHSHFGIFLYFLYGTKIAWLMAHSNIFRYVE